MSIRNASRKLATVLATTVLAGTVAGLTAAPAFASGPANGTQVPSSAVPVGSFTRGTPFSSGQNIEVTIPANSDLQPGLKVNILECARPRRHGRQSADRHQRSVTGRRCKETPFSSSRTARSTSADTRLRPSRCRPAWGSRAATRPACDLSHECVLYVGENQNDFTAPHVFSQPFLRGSQRG